MITGFEFIDLLLEPSILHTVLPEDLRGNDADLPNVLGVESVVLRTDIVVRINMAIIFTSYSMTGSLTMYLDTRNEAARLCSTSETLD